MKKYFLFVIVLTCFFISPSYSGTFIPHSGSPDDSLKIIEKVYLQTDRDSYYAGEDIWFKAYLIDALDHLLTDHSSNLHVELISPFSKIIAARIIRLEGGMGDGDFKLQGDIKSGKYKLRAYTNYMRNFSDQLFFAKEIAVINAKGGEAEITDKIIYIENKIQIGFFPEGGSLVDNVSSIVAFKAVDSQGKGCDVSGKIYASNGDLVTAFKSTHNGMGSFLLTPLPGMKYYSKAMGADSIDFRSELPESFPEGVTLSPLINENNDLLITAKTNSETLATLTERDLLLTISIRQEVINTIPFSLKSPVASFVVPAGYLPEGILMLTLSATESLPLSERLIYIERDAPSKIQIQTDKQIYKKRDQVNLKISLPGDSSIERDGNVSLSVVDETFLNSISQYPSTISSWFLLESDIRGVVEDPSYYFDPSNPERLKDMDLLLRTQGWRDFTWKYDTAYFPPENGFTVSGRLRKDNKNKVTVDSRVSIGIFGSKSTLMSTVPVDSTGRFELSGIDLTGEATLIVTGIGKKDRPEGFVTLDTVTYSPAEVSEVVSTVSVLAENNQGKLKSYYTISESIRKKYKLSDTVSLGEVNIISAVHKDPQTVKIESSRLKYVKPESELIVTEPMLGYVKMIYLLKGKIPGLIVLGDTSITIRGYGSLNFNKKPLILIDGNQALFRDLLDMPICLVDRIDVLKSVASTSIYGFQGSGGVINIITKAGGVPDIYTLPEYSAKQSISGYSASRIFYSPQHLPNSNSDLNPDLRSTLYWNPNINLECTNEVVLNYYNCDNSSIVRIIVEGITTTGIPVTGKAEYEVR
jgi:hypothetical protein